MAQANGSGSGAGLKARSICLRLPSRPWKAAALARAHRAGEQGWETAAPEPCAHQRGSEMKRHGSHAFGKHFASALPRDTRPSWWREGPEKSRKEKTARRAVELCLSYFVCTRLPGPLSQGRFRLRGSGLGPRKLHGSRPPAFLLQSATTTLPCAEALVR